MSFDAWFRQRPSLRKGILLPAVTSRYCHGPSKCRSMGILLPGPLEIGKEGVWRWLWAGVAWSLGHSGCLELATDWTAWTWCVCACLLVVPSQQGGSARRFSLKGRERVVIDQTNIGTVSKATLGTLLRDRCGAHNMSFSERNRYHLELN